MGFGDGWFRRWLGLAAVVDWVVVVADFSLCLV